MAKGPTRSAALEAEWRARISRHEASGRSARDFCRNENLKESAFYYWRRELSRRDGQSSGTAAKRGRQQPARGIWPPFLPVTVGLTSPAPIEIALPGGVSIRVVHGCDESLLKMVVEALQEL